MAEQKESEKPEEQTGNVGSGNINIDGSVGGSVIVGSNNLVGYTSDQVSALITQISTTFEPKPFDGRSPYKGLAYFEEEDAKLFFGREKWIEDLVNRLRDSRTLFVTGPSGSGKSSLVRAGLIHTLKQGRIENSERWLYATMKPGREPVAELARVTAKLARSTNAEDEICARAASDLTIFRRWCEMALGDGRDQRVVIFIDQFEEVFTQIKSEAAKTFINLLDDAVVAQNGRVILLFAMRSDFIPNCATFPKLNALLNRQFVQIGAMSGDELVSAIAQPALRVGLRIEAGLITQIIKDMQGEPGALPLMQFALKDLFDFQQAQGGLIALTLEDYLKRGGIHKALERHANDSFNKLDNHEQELARSVFSGLIEIGRGTQDTRRTAIFDELVPASAKSEEVEAIVHKLADARLITTDEIGGRDTVTISHEKLIDAWPWLKKLVNENRDVIALQNEITEDANEWEEHKRDGSYLYSGARLANTREQLKSNKLILSSTAYDFVQAGVARQQREQRTKILGIATAIGLIIAAIALFSFVSTNSANKLAEQSNNFANTQAALASTSDANAAVAEANAAEAQKQAKISRAGELAAQSVALREKNFLVSLLLGVEAFKMLPAVQEQSALLDNTQANPQLEQFLSGDKGPVLSVAFSPDGKTLVSGTYINPILLWDMETRKPVGQLDGHSDIVRSVAFSRDGKTLASGSEEKNILLWDVESCTNPQKEKACQPIGELKGHSDIVNSVAFSLDGKILASGSCSKRISQDLCLTGEIIWWDILTGKPISKLPIHAGDVTAVAFSPDGKTLASSSEDRTIILWDAETREPVGQPLKGHSGPVLSVAFSPDGKTLASGSYDQTILLWDVEACKSMRDDEPCQPMGQPLERHSDIIRSVAFSPDGKMLASGSYDRTIILWNLESRLPVGQPLSGNSDIVNSVAFSPDGKTLVSGGGDAAITLWDLEPRQRIRQQLDWHSGPVSSIAFSRDGKTLASGSGAGEPTIILWDVETGKQVGQPLSGHVGPLTSVVFSPDGKTLASGSFDKTIILWDVETGKQIGKPLSKHSEPVFSVAFSPDGKTLASGSFDKTIILWDVKTGQQIGAPLSGHSDLVTSVAFSPDGKTLASGSQDKTVRLWNVKNGQQIGKPMSRHWDVVRSVAFSPDGKMLASGSEDHTILLWDVQTHLQVGQPLSEHSDLVLSIAFSPDGKTLASGSQDRTIILWDVETHKPIGQPLRGHKDLVASVVFSPDGKTLASGSQDIFLWDLHPQSWMEKSCHTAGRNFTLAEWENYFPKENYRKTCPQFELVPAPAPTAVPTATSQ